jgi:hypothetical protein
MESFGFWRIEEATVTRREREARDHAIVAARRRGVSCPKLAESYGLTPQRIRQMVMDWDDVPSVPRITRT